MNTPEDLLLSDFNRVAERAYSEEGIPMFLACEDLGANGDATTLAPLNEDLALAFRNNAAAWLSIRPDAAETDACKIVEVLAARDFGAGGTEKAP